RSTELFSLAEDSMPRLTQRVRFAAFVIAALLTHRVRADAQAKFVLSSSDLHASSPIAAAQVYNSFGCTGNNISPALEGPGAPPKAKTFALTAYDPDGPPGSGWWHWVVFNIPATTTKLAAGAGDPKKNLLPAGAAQGNTDFGAPGYGGPCPPKGDKPH